MVAPADTAPIVHFDDGTQQRESTLSWEQEYAFDTLGFLHLEGVIPPSLLVTLRADPSAAASLLLDPGAPLHKHLSELCGHAFRLDGTPRLATARAAQQLVGGNVGGLDRAYLHLAGWNGSGEQSLTRAGGAWEPVSIRQCQGLLVAVALTDTGPDDSAVSIVPASHKSDLPPPTRAQDCAGLLERQSLAAGQVLLCAASTLHGIGTPGAASAAVGTLPHGELLLLDCISGTAAPSAPLALAPLPPWAAELSDVEQAVLAGGAGNGGTVLSDGCRVWLTESPAPLSSAHPSALEPTPAAEMAREMWEFDTTGYVKGDPQSLPARDLICALVPKLIKLSECAVALASGQGCDGPGVGCGRGRSDRRQSESNTAPWGGQPAGRWRCHPRRHSRGGFALRHRPAGLGWPLRFARAALHAFPQNARPSRRHPPAGKLRCPLPALHCTPARRWLLMLAGFGALQQLHQNWMLGAGFKVTQNTALCHVAGSSGQMLHAGNANPTSVGKHFETVGGRVRTTSNINVAYNLTPQRHGDGGFCIVPGACFAVRILRALTNRAPCPLETNQMNHPRCPTGSHKANYPLPHTVRTANCREPIRQLELGRGDLLFFLGGTVTHGAYRWESPTPRRTCLFSYQQSAPFGWPKM